MLLYFVPYNLSIHDTAAWEGYIMMQIRTQDEFLEWLNKSLNICQDAEGQHEFHELTDTEHEGQETLELGQKFKLVWAIDVDRVVEGPCGDEPVFPSDDPHEYPMGKCMKHVDEPADAPYKSWIHSILEDDPAEISKIVVYATCCGYYPRWYRDLLTKEFPKVSWTFVDICDLHENSYKYPHWIAKYFVVAGAMKVVVDEEK